MKKISVTAFLLALSAVLTACGGGSGSIQPGPGVTVSISPSAASMLVRANATFKATVNGSSEARVTFAVREGDAAGNVTPDGSYLAPPTPGTYHLRATSVADPTKFAEAVVTVHDYSKQVQRRADAPDGFDYGSATLLNDGKILIVGGRGLAEAVHKNSYWYLPTDQTFTPSAQLTQARFAHTAFILSDGRVVITGGDDLTPVDPFRPALASTEIYNPATDSFTNGPDMTVPRFHHVATQLKDNRVLLTGGLQIAGSSGFGASPNTEIYDPIANTFTAASRMVENGRWLHTATLLNDGLVLLVGGRNNSCTGTCPVFSLASAEIFNPATGTYMATGPLNISRHNHTATLLADGRVLVIGGETTEDLGTGSSEVQQAEIYDPATGMFSYYGNMLITRGRHTATLLNNGKLLIMGGEIRSGAQTASTELLDIASGVSTPGPELNETHIRAHAIRLATGEVVLLGGSLGYQPSTVVELFR